MVCQKKSEFEKKKQNAEVADNEAKGRIAWNPIYRRSAYLTKSKQPVVISLTKRNILARPEEKRETAV